MKETFDRRHWKIRGVIALSLLLGVASISNAGLSCYDCHGNRNSRDIRPADRPSREGLTGGFRGNHETHVPSSAKPTDCAPCHPGSDAYSSGHRNGTIELSSKLNASPQSARYGSYTAGPLQTSNPALTNCTNVNCHFEAPTPLWGSDRLGAGQCATCHGAPPSDGNHPALSGKGQKHGEYYGTDTTSCSKCHTDHTKEQDPYAHALSAGKRPLAVEFSSPNSGGNYSGDVSYPNYLPSSNPSRNGTCSNLYCHSDAMGRAPGMQVRWSDSSTTKCYSCHRGRTADNTMADCNAIGGSWNSSTGLCTPYVNMTSNGHGRLVGPQWIRKYPCTFCHNNTVQAVIDANGKMTDGAIITSKHVNGSKDVAFPDKWNIVGRPAASYSSDTKTCQNVYCHSDGTTNPDIVRPFGWAQHGTDCNSCHGHPRGSCSLSGCHDGRTDDIGRVWVLPPAYGSLPSYKWPSGQEWKAAIPMFSNEGPGKPRANSHMRHTETNFTCDECHASTIVNGTCTDCHVSGIPTGQMSETAHLNADYHVNKSRDVVFKQGGTYNSITKTCSNTKCHGGGNDPQWGSSLNVVICLSCHGTTTGDVDSFGFNVYSTQARINMTEWMTTGHGRPSSSGPYPGSGNPAANFPGNPCWYCHDNTIIHNDRTNPFRLRQHQQFSNRFEKECVYCHMEGKDSECLGCHVNTESLAPQLSTLPALPTATWPDGTPAPRPDHRVMTDGATSCLTSQCHYLDPSDPKKDMKLHNAGAGLWSAEQKADVKNQYMMMGVCLKCHDDDSGSKCVSCHTSPAANPFKYTLGFDPGTGFIKPQKARASSVHFGRKHYSAHEKDGTWKGGKFCWDCHDPHGDSNIYMIQSKVATSTDGSFGVPKTRASVVFTRKQSGLDYARTTAPYNGICNVCHSAGSQHFRVDGGDSHNTSRICTTCHEHRFTDSHADNQSCSTCHMNKPVPRHSGFGLPRDCTKCHAGTINMRMDVMGQFNGTSHHVQGVNVTNKQCYACHWEATPDGLINVTYHEGYNYKTYTSVKNAKVDLVAWKPGVRPTYYNTTTSVTFLASRMGTANERTEAGKLNNHCVSCHSDNNNSTQPFGDCKTPNQYSPDRTSVATRYLQTGTTPWGKYATNGKSGVTKALSAHGNAKANQGGWDRTNGLDSTIPNKRGATQNVLCFDCHSSHGSKVVGITSSYVTFNGTMNGGNLKETQAGKGGYSMSYKASANLASGAINPYSAGAGQCFDCHFTPNAGATPWGYKSTFGVMTSIKGYFDSDKFGSAGNPGNVDRLPFRAKTMQGGHLKASAFLNSTTSGYNRINGLCTPCHDPHGVSPSLGANQKYGVPLLKGTWVTSPYKEDRPAPTANPPGTVAGTPNVAKGMTINEDATVFGGLCLTCHNKEKLTNGTDHAWNGKNRIHESVKGWKTANATPQHDFTCSKCHAPHVTDLPRLMVTNCLDYKHRGEVMSGGQPGSGGYHHGEQLYSTYRSSRAYTDGSFPRGRGSYQVNCHPGSSWPDNKWNNKTQW